MRRLSSSAVERATWSSVRPPPCVAPMPTSSTRSCGTRPSASGRRRRNRGSPQLSSRPMTRSSVTPSTGLSPAGIQVRNACMATVWKRFLALRSRFSCRPTGVPKSWISRGGYGGAKVSVSSRQWDAPGCSRRDGALPHRGCGLWPRDQSGGVGQTLRGIAATRYEREQETSRNRAWPGVHQTYCRGAGRRGWRAHHTRQGQRILRDPSTACTAGCRRRTRSDRSPSSRLNCLGSFKS